MRLAAIDPRRPPLRWLLRAPIVLYRLGLGAVLGSRFAQLVVRGRRSGLPRRVVLEVLRRDDASGALLVASAWSERAEWYRNLAADPRAEVRSGWRSFTARAEVLDEAGAAHELERYAQEHRFAYRWFIGPLLLGRRPTRSPEELTAASRSLRIVRLAPTDRDGAK